VRGAWNLQMINSKTGKSLASNETQSNSLLGSGSIGDWVLIITDYANLLRLVYMDVTGTLIDLPKYGDLYSETVTAVEGWELFFGEPAATKVAVGASNRVLGSCAGTDPNGPYRTCYYNFGVAPSLSPPGSSDRAVFTFLDRERIIYYRPKLNFLGVDTFTYRISTGVTPSQSKGQVTVHVRNCRGMTSPVGQPARGLCACVRTDHAYFGSPSCPEAITTICADADLSMVFQGLCATCMFSMFSVECVSEVHRATVLMTERGMCETTSSTDRDCRTERFSLPPRESFTTGESPVAMWKIMPLKKGANLGRGFMYTPPLA